MDDHRGRSQRGLLWSLPILKSRDLGKLGPAFGVGAGCGVGLGFGLIGGIGIGAGFPGFHFGFGIGSGCGIGIGFGYGAGKGIAYDEYRRYSNVGNLFHSYQKSQSRDQVDVLVSELIENTRKLIKATSREIDKWTRN